MPAVNIRVPLLLIPEDTFPKHIKMHRARPQLCFPVIFIFTTRSEKLLLETRDDVQCSSATGLNLALLILAICHSHPRSRASVSGGFLFSRTNSDWHVASLDFKQGNTSTAETHPQLLKVYREIVSRRYTEVYADF